MKHYNKIYLFCIIIVILASINWGIVGTFNVNLFEVLIHNKNIRYIIYMLIGLSALFLCFQKSLWSPEQAESLLPNKIIPIKEPIKYTHIIKIKAKDGKKIVYWTDDDVNYGAVISEKDNFARIKLDIDNEDKNKTKNKPKKLYYRKYNSDNKIGQVKIINI